MSYQSYFENAVAASQQMAGVSNTTINATLKKLAEAAIDQTDFLLAENKKDLDRMDPQDPKYDRLQLTEERIKAIAADIVNVSELKSPLGLTLEERDVPSGLHIKKVSVPLGVVGVIYEARPNVTFDVFALCFKTGNICILKGGSDADFSNRAIIGIIHQVLREAHLETAVATLLPPEREATHALLNATGMVDVLIPRGSQSLINYVRENSKVPVIETGAGIVHTYIDLEADAAIASPIVFNAKTRRVSVCNALDCLLVHNEQLNNLATIVLPMAEKQVQIYADEPAYAALEGVYPYELLAHAEPQHFGTEFLDYKLAVKTVSGLDEALAHIAKHSSKHSEAIITQNDLHAAKFMQQVDAAAVYVNTSTAFTDGAQFGLGAEIGISTQKLHARGPMALKELTSYKWLVTSGGKIRNA